MKEAVIELRNLLQPENTHLILSAGTSFDCTWNSRGWHKELAKLLILYIKVPECQRKQSDSDAGKISGLDYLDWYILHELTCFMNHARSP